MSVFSCSERWTSKISSGIMRSLRCMKLISHADYSKWLKRQLLYKDSQYFQSILAEVLAFGKPFYLDPLRCAYSEIFGVSGFGKMVDHDAYGLRWIKDPNPVFLDVGAHIGTWPRVIKNRFPRSTIHAFEPDRENFNLLKKNNNIIEEAFSYHMGIHNSPSSLSLRTSSQNSWRSAFALDEDFFTSNYVGDDKFEREEYIVSVDTIDNFVANNNLNTVTEIGIVIPGGNEKYALQGAEATIAQYKPQLAVSIQQESQDAVFVFMKRMGYTTFENTFKSFWVFRNSG